MQHDSHIALFTRLCDEIRADLSKLIAGARG